LSVDPMAHLYPGWSPYNYTLNNPINYFDPDGTTTFTDTTGTVIDVTDDGSTAVVQLLPDGRGMYMGETEYWDEFIDPETGEIGEEAKIIFGESWEETINQMHEQAHDEDLRWIATESRPGGKFDIKVGRPYEGRLLEGKYYSARSAGNYLAAFNASHGRLMGFRISFETFAKLAGALHVKQGKLTDWDKVMVTLFGKSYGPPPGYGEIEYAYRMFPKGWKRGHP